MTAHMLPKPRKGAATAMRRARSRLAQTRLAASCVLVRERDAGRCRVCGASGWAEVHARYECLDKRNAHMRRFAQQTTSARLGSFPKSGSPPPATPILSTWSLTLGGDEMSCLDVPPSADDTGLPRQSDPSASRCEVQDRTLPGIGPVFPRRPLDRGRLLLARTRELIDARAKVRQLERECGEIIASLHEGR